MVLTNHLEDDWDDNSITGRTNPSKDIFYEYHTGGTGDLLKGVYRPRWETIQGSVSASNGKLQWNSVESIIDTPSNFTVGYWEWDWQYGSSGANTNGDLTGALMHSSNGGWEAGGSSVRPNDGYSHVIEEPGDGGNYQILVTDGGVTALINQTWTEDTNLHTARTTRDSYGNFELFFDGGSKGTATDTTYTDSELFGFSLGNDGVDCTVDNMVIK